MIYELLEQGSLNVRSAQVFYFDVGPYVYLSKREDNDDPNELLSLYIPSNEQAGQMLKQYQSFCAENQLTEKAELVTELTSIDPYKALLLAQVERGASAFEANLNKDMFFTSSLGFKVNGDRRTKDNLQDLVTFFDYQAPEGMLAYRDYNNEVQNITKEQVQLLLMEHVANGNRLYAQKWAFQENINNAKSFDDLRKVDYVFKMQDFRPVEEPEPEPEPEQEVAPGGTDTEVVEPPVGEDEGVQVAQLKAAPAPATKRRAKATKV